MYITNIGYEELLLNQQLQLRRSRMGAVNRGIIEENPLHFWLPFGEGTDYLLNSANGLTKMEKETLQAI